MAPRFDNNMAWNQIPESHETLPIRLRSQASSTSENDTFHTATMAAYQRDYPDYRVGILCVSAIEKAAMVMMIDERHIGLPNKDGDENEYTLGRIGIHNVVIASLPESSFNESAVQIASNMQRTFPIKYHVLVGLGGGIWSKDKDIRLGDVVVSNPFGHCQGSIQWNTKKMYSVGAAPARPEEEPSISLPSPLLHALQSVREKELIHGLDLAASLSTSIWRQVQSVGTYQYQGATMDVLFRSNYQHTTGKTCKDGCDPSMFIRRPARTSRVPKIHYGIIASGTKIVKSGKSRDNVANKLNAICFDNHATGLMKAFPSLIIKGICDYTDSHKNSRWQPYAAGIAAAFAKKVVLCLDEKISNPCCPRTLLNFKEFSSDGHTKLLQAFQTTSYESDKNRSPSRLPGSFQWFLSHLNYQKWNRGPTSPLWIAGDMGSGKSVLARSLAENELSSNTLRTTASFFFKHDKPPRPDRRSQILDCLCAILHQLFTQKRNLLKYAIAAFEAYLDLQSFEKLWTLLLEASNDPDAGEIVCIVDGLDECDEFGRGQFIKALDTLNANTDEVRQFPRLKFVITTRNSSLLELYANTTGALSIIQFASEELSAEMNSEIAYLMKTEVAKMGAGYGIPSSWQDALMLKVHTVPEKTYLWLVLVVEVLRKSLRNNTVTINGILEIIPKTVEEAFEANLGMINASRVEHMRKLLHILVAAERSLTIDELNIAMGLEIDSAQQNDLGLHSEYLYQEELEDICRPLIRVADGKVYLFHDSLREYLISRPRSTTLLPKLGFGSESWAQSFSPTQSHCILAERCVQYLLLDDFGRMSPVEEDELEDLYEDYPFLEYAAKYWILHVRFAKPNDHITIGKQTLQGLIDPRYTRFRLWYTARHSITDFCDVSRRPTALMIACYVGIVSLVSQKIEVTVDMNEQDTKGYTPLMYAIRRNNVEAARLVIEHGGNVNYQFEQGSQTTTPLICAIQKNGSEMVALLLTYGANVNTPNWRGQTPLLVASMMNNLELTKLLLQNGARKDIRDVFHYSALLWAAKNKNMEIAKLILEGGYIQDDSEDRQAVLEWAAGHGDSAIVGLIMSSAHRLQSSGPHERPLLCIAAGQGHCGVIAALLVEGADVNERDSSGHTSLFWAAAAGREAVVRLLLDNGAHQVGHYLGDLRTPLSKAAENGSVPIVAMLIEAECKVDAVDGRGRTPLCWASLKGHEPVVRLLLSHNADPNYEDERCYSPLLWALQGRHEAVAILLIESGADVDVADDNGWPPIVYALEAGNIDFGKMLINAGTDVNASFRFDVKVPYRRSLLFWSIMRGYATFTELLLTHGANPNIEDGETERTPLVKAIDQEREDIVRLLLAHRADPNFLGEGDRSPLSRACERGHNAIILMLLDAGGNIDSADASGWTPLSWAIRSTHRSVSKMLVERGAKTDSLPYNHWQTCLQWAIEDGDLPRTNLLLETYLCNNKSVEHREKLLSWAVEHGHEDLAVRLIGESQTQLKREYCGSVLTKATEKGLLLVTGFLLLKGADFNSTDPSGITPLSKAVRNGHDRILELFLNRGGNPNAMDISGQTLLSLAARNGHVAVIEVLLGRSAKVESRDLFGQSPLIWASREGHTAAAKMLLKNKADVSVTDHMNRTALWRAVEGNHVEIVESLVDNGADLETSESEDGHTPLSLASYSGNLETVKLLVQLGAQFDKGDKNGRTPLSWSAEQGHLQVVEYLLSLGANHDSMDDEFGRTPLSYTAENGHSAIITLLQSKRVYVDALDIQHGRTPLIWACQGGHYESALLLLYGGAQINSKDFNGRTSLSWAAGNGHERIVKLLLTENADADIRDDSHCTALSWAATHGHTSIAKHLRDQSQEISDAIMKVANDDEYGMNPYQLNVFTEPQPQPQILEKKSNVEEDADMHDGEGELDLDSEEDDGTEELYFGAASMTVDGGGDGDMDWEVL